MAITKSGSISLLVIAVASCLIVIAAEEELPASKARQSKQIFLVPSMTPASTFPLGYYGKSPLAYPFLMPQQGSPIRSDPVEQLTEASEWPMVPAENEEQGAAWSVYDSVDDIGAKWWRRPYNREAVININPSSAECLRANILTDGLGPCKRASQANQGTISIKFSATNQIAVIAITASSSANTRVRLICNQLLAVAPFTQTGKIATIADTPRTEVGYMHLVVTSTDADATLKCFWITYRHYTATFP